jgi:hypothetical protein
VTTPEGASTEAAVIELIVHPFGFALEFPTGFDEPSILEEIRPDDN